MTYVNIYDIIYDMITSLGGIKMLDIKFICENPELVSASKILISSCGNDNILIANIIGITPVALTLIGICVD